MERHNQRKTNDIEYTLTPERDKQMTDILNDNEGAGPGETTCLTERGLHIVHILEQSEDDQSNGK